MNHGANAAARDVDHQRGCGAFFLAAVASRCYAPGMAAEQRVFYCQQPWQSLTVTCDGRVVCGCGDPMMLRIVGDANNERITDIFNGPLMSDIRERLRHGQPHAHCLAGVGCPLGWWSPATAAPPVPVAHPAPIQMYIEPTVLCNLSCDNPVCARDTGIRETRLRPFLDRALFSKVVNEAGPSLHRMDFYNYGEPFLHPETPAMIRELKDRFPHVYANTSTNGMALTAPELREAVVRSGIDEILFSIDGSDQESYARYRRGGNFSRVLDNLKGIIQTRDRLDQIRPYVIWRYILFRWNDSDAHLDQARQLAHEIGVDRFCFLITCYPPGAESDRFRPGTPEFEKIRNDVWSFGRHAMKRTFISVKTLPFLRRGQPERVKVVIMNTGGLPWKAATRWGSRFVSVGAQLFNNSNQLINRDYARALLPRDTAPGDRVEVTVPLPPLSERGRYRLRFDMVYEGVAWFSDLGNVGEPAVERGLFVF